MSAVTGNLLLMNGHTCQANQVTFVSSLGEIVS